MEHTEQMIDLGEKILAEYDKAIRSCESGDQQAAVTVLVGLMEGLSFENKEIAGGLLTLYDYCITRIRAGQLDEAQGVLCQLRDSWKQGIEGLQAGQPRS